MEIFDAISRRRKQLCNTIRANIGLLVHKVYVLHSSNTKCEFEILNLFNKHAQKRILTNFDEFKRNWQNS